MSTPLDRPGFCIHNRLFILIFHFNSHTHLRFSDHVASLQRAFLPEKLAELPERHLDEVKNRFGRSAVEDKTRRTELTSKGFKIFRLGQRTEMHWKHRLGHACRRSSLGQCRVIDDSELLSLVDVIPKASGVRLG